LIVEEGDQVRIHFVNAGYESHAMHNHNHGFTVVEKDGGVIPEAARHREDVIPIAPAERKTIEFTADADPGVYALHCHKVNHAMNGDSYPGGMIGGMVYERDGLRAVRLRDGDGGLRSLVGLSQVGLLQVGLSQVGLSQVGLSQVGLSQVGLSQVGLR